MSAKTSSSFHAGPGNPALAGTPGLVDAYSISDSAILIARPHTHAIVSGGEAREKGGGESGHDEERQRRRVERRHRA